MFSWFNKFVISDRVVSIILLFILLLLLIYTYNSDWSDRVGRDNVSAGFFPKAVLIMSIFFCLGIYFSKYSSEVPEKLKNFDSRTLIISVSTLFLCWVYFKLILKFGFIIPSFIFLYLTIYYLGPKSWKISLTTSIIIIFFIYTFFTLLQVPTEIFGY